VSIAIGESPDQGVIERFKQRRAEKKMTKSRYKALGFCITPFATPLKFVGLILTTVVATYIGVDIVSALYYLLVGADWTPLNGPWHQLFTDDATRHMIRNVSEGLLGGLLGQAAAFNYYKKVIKKKPGIVDKFSRLLRIPSAWDDKLAGPIAILLNPFAVLLFAVPGFILGFWTVHELHHILNWVVATQSHGTLSLPDRMQAGVTSEYDQKIIGLFASFFLGRKAALGVMSDMQERFAAIRVCNNKPLGGTIPRHLRPATTCLSRPA
jgi:hypothetical protein